MIPDLSRPDSVRLLDQGPIPRRGVHEAEPDIRDRDRGLRGSPRHGRVQPGPEGPKPAGTRIGMSR